VEKVKEEAVRQFVYYIRKNEKSNLVVMGINNLYLKYTLSQPTKEQEYKHGK
jgi:hypothetical protein